MWEDTEAWITIGWISVVVVIIIVGLRLGAEAMGFDPGSRPPTPDDEPPPSDQEPR